jgi:hypothetical protein
VWITGDERSSVAEFAVSVGCWLAHDVHTINEASSSGLEHCDYSRWSKAKLLTFYHTEWFPPSDSKFHIKITHWTPELNILLNCLAVESCCAANNYIQIGLQTTHACCSSFVPGSHHSLYHFAQIADLDPCFHMDSIFRKPDFQYIYSSRRRLNALFGWSIVIQLKCNVTVQWLYRSGTFYLPRAYQSTNQSVIYSLCKTYANE